MFFKTKRYQLESRRQSTKPIWLFLAIPGLAALILITIKDLSSPAVGSLSQTPPASQTTSNSAKLDGGQYNGKYISFVIPSGYKKVPSKLTGNYLEVIDLYAINHTSERISVGVRRQLLADESAITFRRQRPETYKLERRTISSYIFISHQNGFERAAFLAHNDLLANAVATAPNGQDLTTASNQLLSSLTWK